MPGDISDIVYAVAELFRDSCGLIGYGSIGGIGSVRYACPCPCPRIGGNPNPS